ncbi:MAG: Uma2 family endonuclease [Cyanobacteria bacterium P01_G01_bin.49]
MVVQNQKTKISTPEEYLDLEEKSPEKNEYIKGNIIQMAGGTPNHNKLAGNFYAALNFALKGQPLDVFVTDQRLWIPSEQIYTYPDIMIMTNPLEYAENRNDTLISPLLIGEVLSKSTRNFDKDEKFAAYRTFSSFQEYILIDQYCIHVEQYIRTEPNKWLFIEYNQPEMIVSLSSVNVQIEIADIYDKVNLD